MSDHGRTTLLRIILLALALPLLVGAAKPPASRPGARALAQRETAARKALSAVTDRYRAMRGYQLEGRGGTKVTSSQGGNESVTWVRFQVSRPNRYSGEIRSNDMTTRLVMDGDSLWTAIPDLGQYQVQTVASVRSGMDSTTWTRQFDPAFEYGHLLEDLVSATPLGRDTVHTNAGPVTCDRFAVMTKAASQAGDGIVVHPRVLWVDPATQMVLLDSVQIDQKHATLGEITSVNVTRMVVAKPDPAFAADAFRFRDGSLKRVRRFTRTSAEHAALEGQQASDFTLETLDGAKSVKLSELKGQVVLLDFWATWCGPCRGWLPIVAKAHREYEAKGLRVFAVNEREPEAKVRSYLTKQNLNVPVLMDRSGQVGSMYRASSIPLTVVIGRDGNVLRVLVGLHGEEDLKDVLTEAGLVL